MLGGFFYAQEHELLIAVNTLVGEDEKMSELESVNIGAETCDGITCNTECSEPIDEFESAHDARIILQSDVCADGLCPLNWKPLRHNAA